MASLLISDLDDALHAQLRRRARLHGRSLEDEARETLRIVIARDASEPSGAVLVELAARLFGPGNGFDLDLPPRSSMPERPPLDFSGPEYDR